MKAKIINLNWERSANVFMICCIFAVSISAIAAQIFWHDLPCPLCLLQRVGFIAMAYGLLLNLRFGMKPIHYSITLLSSIFTAAVALRQIVLHIIPGTGVYGSALLGYHLYTWSFIAAGFVLLGVCILLGSDRQYIVKTRSKEWELATKILFDITIIILVINIISVVAVCGFARCPDNPTSYLVG